MESHSVSKIIGSPPGYIGFDQEGGLTGRARTEPYSIILLDEVEKAHPNVLNIFLQVFEDGRLTDSQGRTVYFNNCTIIMTSNVGAAKAFSKRREIGFNESEALNLGWSKQVIMEAVRKHFNPEFLNRIDEIILFKPLNQETIKKIAALKLMEIIKRFTDESKEIKISDEVLELISKKGYNPEYGARFLNRTIEDTLLKPLSKIVLAKPESRLFSVNLGHNSDIIILGEVD
jgi:ATP-dependent Clp protease ATP-binding subunit ClpA